MILDGDLTGGEDPRKPRASGDDPRRAYERGYVTS